MAPGHSSKRRRLSPAQEDTNGNNPKLNAFYSQAAEWDLEQDYEKRPRKAKEQQKTRLPIKTAEGELAHIDEPEIVDGGSDSDPFATDEEDEADTATKAARKPPPVSTVPPKVQILGAKEELAKIAMLINEEPEEHMELLKRLEDMFSSTSLNTVKKLVLATQAAVYKDIIPGYRIRGLSNEDMTAKVSKDVRQLRSFEQSLLSGYRSYVQNLAQLARARRGSAADQEGLRSVAVNCACSLLSSVPHFNLRSELLKMVIGQLTRRQIDPVFIKSRETLEELFSSDDGGILSMEAVNLITKMMKGRNFRVHPSVVDTFLHLRLLSEFSAKGSKDRIDKVQDDDHKGKKPKQKREFRTKKERKVMKERKAVEKDMKEADALVSHEHRDKMQAETLKLVFTTYFRILKLRNPDLVGAVLEGLAKFAHLINQDFFADLLEVLRDLVTRLSDGISAETPVEGEDEEEDEESNTVSSNTRNTTRDTLLCSTTAFALLEGQEATKAASTLHLDLGFFITHLYQSLYPLSTSPDIEYNPNKSLRLPDPQAHDHDRSSSDALAQQELLKKSSKKVDFHTPTVLLIRCLQPVLTAKGSKAPPPIRVASFTKRLMTSVLQLPEKSALALLGLLARVAKLHGRKIAPLWNTEERKGDGVFNPVATDIEGSNVFAGTVWEGELLRVHYCPQVRDAARDIEKIVAAVK